MLPRPKGRHAIYLGWSLLAGLKWSLQDPHRQKWRCEIRQGGRHRQTRRWSTPARIVGCGDASSRSVATAGDWRHRRQWRCCSSTCGGYRRLGIVGCAMLERGENRPGCPRRQVCMRFREEETAPAIGEENRAGLMCSSATLAGFFDFIRCERPPWRCSICCCFFSTCFCPVLLFVARHFRCKVSDEAAFCLIQRPYISKLCLPGAFRPGSP